MTSFASSGSFRLAWRCVTVWRWAPCGIGATPCRLGLSLACSIASGVRAQCGAASCCLLLDAGAGGRWPLGLSTVLVRMLASDCQLYETRLPCILACQPTFLFFQMSFLVEYRRSSASVTSSDGCRKTPMGNSGLLFFRFDAFDVCTPLFSSALRASSIICDGQIFYNEVPRRV